MTADFPIRPAQSISSPPFGGLEGVRVVKYSFNNKRTAKKPSFYCWWAIRDSNPGPTGYEPVALTN